MGSGMMLRVVAWLLATNLLAAANVFLWDHSARFITSDNMKSSDWYTYSEGPTTVLSFADWPMERMARENKTTLFIRLTFLVRDTSTGMITQVQEEEGEACLIDGSRPPNHESSSGNLNLESTGFRVALRNRGTWSSIVVELPNVASLFLKTIIVPYAETDVDIRVNFLANEISARVSPRLRAAGAQFLSIKPTVQIPPLYRWPQLLTFGADRHSLNRFSPDADWEVYSTSVKLGHISEGWEVRRDYDKLQKGLILYRMNDPPIRFAKTLRTKIASGQQSQSGSNFHLRIAFSFTLTNRWRKWFDDPTTKPADLDSPSLVCMVKPVSADSRTNQPYPAGLRMWVKPDLTSTDNFLVVELGDGAGFSHRLQIAWPPVSLGVKYNVEFLVFFLPSGSPDTSKLPLVRLTRDSVDTGTEQIYLVVPKIPDSTRTIMTYDLWVASFGGAAFSSVVVGGPCRGVARADAVVMKTESFVVESVEFTLRSVLPTTSKSSNATFFNTPPVSAVAYMVLPVSQTGGVTGFRKRNYMRGADQKDSPRYVHLPAGLNFTEDPFIFSQALVIAGEVALTTCQVQAWGQNLTDLEIANDVKPSLSLLPLVSVPDILSVAVDCATGRLSVQTPYTRILDERFIFSNSFRSFRVTLTMPSTTSSPNLSDLLDVSVGDAGTIRSTFPQRLPRSNWGPELWLGREITEKRIVYGSVGWQLRNVEISSFEYGSCGQLGTSICNAFTNCAWKTNLGCRAATVLQGQNATQTPTLSTRPPSLSPTTQPTTKKPTMPGVTYAPSRSPTETTATPSTSPTTQATPSPTLYAGVRTSAPTLDPTPPPVEYEYEYEQHEYETQSPVLSSPPPSVVGTSTASPTLQETASPSRLDTSSPSSSSAPSGTPATPAPTKPTTLSPNTRSPTVMPTPTASPTSKSPVPAPTRSPSTIMPTSPSAHPSESPTASPDSTSLSESNSNSSASNSAAVGAAVGTTFGLLALAGVGFFAYRYRRTGPRLVTAPPQSQPQQLPGKPSPRKHQTPPSLPEDSVEFNIL